MVLRSCYVQCVREVPSLKLINMLVLDVLDEDLLLGNIVARRAGDLAARVSHVLSSAQNLLTSSVVVGAEMNAHSVLGVDFGCVSGRVEAAKHAAEVGRLNRGKLDVGLQKLETTFLGSLAIAFALWQHDDVVTELTPVCRLSTGAFGRFIHSIRVHIEVLVFVVVNCCDPGIESGDSGI